MVSMQDIADRVGVSKSAVSLVLNGKAGNRVSEGTRMRILKAASDMNYQVNEVARSLRTGQSGIISVIVTDISNEFFGRLVSRIQEEAKKQGYLVLTVNTNESADEFASAVRKLMGKHVDGIISVTPPGGLDTLMEIKAAGIPLVLVDRNFREVGVDFVGVENYTSAKEAVSGLISAGCRRVAYVGRSLDVGTLNERFMGYEDALKEAGLYGTAPVKFVNFGDNEGDGDVREAMRELMAPGSDVDAIFFSSCRMFTQAMGHIPAPVNGGTPDIRLLCFDDASSYVSSVYPVSYVAQPVADIARKAFELLYGRIGGIPGGDEYIFKTKCI